MLRDILVPLDGSPFAERALPLAGRIAKLAKARLHLLRVNEPAAVAVGTGELGLPLSHLAEGAGFEEDYLSRTADVLWSWSGRPVLMHSVDGWPGPEICEEATRLDADLVVMATHGRGGLRPRLGSVADFAVRHLGVPMLLLPPHDHGPPGEHLFRRILVALDFSREGEAIVGPAAELARITGGEIVLIHVMDTLLETILSPAGGALPVGTALSAVARRDAEARLASVARRLEAEGLKGRVTARVLTDVKVSDRLLQTLEEPWSDLLALTTHGASGLRRFLLGSVASQVIQRASKPVLVLRPLSRTARQGTRVE